MILKKGYHDVTPTGSCRHRTRTNLATRRATILFVTVALALFVAASSSPANANSQHFGMKQASDNSTTTALPGGGYVITYTGANGYSLAITVPPAGFQPLTASADQLTEYGFPGRPSDPDALAAWEAAMSAYQSTIVPSAAGATEFLDGTNPSGAFQNSTTDEKYPNWGGYVAHGAAGTYVGVEASVVVPDSISCTESGNDVRGGIWLGLGGYTGSSLIQEGMDWCNGIDSGYAGWQAFGEAIDAANPENPPGPLCGDDLVPPAGDTVYMNMSYEGSNQTAYFYLEDEGPNGSGTAQCSFDLATSSPPNQYYDGRYADWITEQLGNPGDCIVPLVDYSEYGWSDAQATLGSNGSLVSLGSQPNYAIDTGNGESPTEWSQQPTNPPGSKTFDQKWEHYFYTGSLPAC